MTTAGDRSRPVLAHDARIDTHETSAPPRRTGNGAGYPGKIEFGQADARLRSALSRLARDVDPEARRNGAQLAQEATETLARIAERAEQSSTAYKRAQARAAQLGEQLDRLRKRTGKGPRPNSPPDGDAA